MDVRNIVVPWHCSEGGFFKAHLTFPKDYPQKPPNLKFISDMWHPNSEYSVKKTGCHKF